MLTLGARFVLGSTQSKITLNESGGEKIKEVKKRDLRKLEWDFRQEQTPKVC